MAALFNPRTRVDRQFSEKVRRAVKETSDEAQS